MSDITNEALKAIIAEYRKKAGEAWKKKKEEEAKASKETIECK